MKKNNYIKYFVLIALLGILPASASAATVYIESSRASVAVGDTVIVTTKINAEGVTINTVEGDVSLRTGGTSVVAKEFSLANSSFGLWPRTPSLSQDGQTISFVGGVPGGFNIEGATLFKTIFQATKEGSVTITPQNIVAYSNDGKGTKVPVQVKGLTITVTPKKAGVAVDDEWSALVAKDVTPPEDFIIVPGQDNSLFDGKKFVFFSALDNQTGVSYYEVSENGAAPVRSGSTYVLQDQTGKAKLAVTAYDKAGNKKTATYGGVPVSPLQGVSWPTVAIAVIVIVIIFMIIKKWRKSKNNAPLPL